MSGSIDRSPPGHRLARCLRAELALNIWRTATDPLWFVAIHSCCSHGTTRFDHRLCIMMRTSRVRRAVARVFSCVLVCWFGLVRNRQGPAPFDLFVSLFPCIACVRHLSPPHTQIPAITNAHPHIYTSRPLLLLHKTSTGRPPKKQQQPVGVYITVRALSSIPTERTTSQQQQQPAMMTKSSTSSTCITALVALGALTTG